MSNVKKLMMTAAGGGGLNVEDVFSTYLYAANNAAQTITNGIDLAGEGGLVWGKSRSAAQDPRIYDTEGNGLYPNYVYGPFGQENRITFNNNGFSLGTSSGLVGGSGYGGPDYVSWTFRKAPKFFDVVTYTGNGTAGREIAHNLGCDVGFITIKRTDTTGDWRSWLRLSDTTSTYTLLNGNYQGFSNQVDIYGDDTTEIRPTSSVFTIGSNTGVNASGGTYVAYLWAHNDGDGGFGPTGDQDIIKCGSYVGNGFSNGPEIDLGFEPQWILIKNTTTGSTDWLMFDVMRGIVTGGSDARLFPNQNYSESFGSLIDVTSTGFKLTSSDTVTNEDSSNTYFYIAIRRGPMAVPESATDVFAISYGTATAPWFDTGFPVDMALWGSPPSTTAASKHRVMTRFQGGNYLLTHSTAAESALTSNNSWDYMDGFYQNSGANTSWLAWMWRRAPNFFDVVAYTGTGSNQTISHNLGVAPEFIIVKELTTVNNWQCYLEALGNDKRIALNASGGSTTDTTAWQSTTPTDSAFYVGANTQTNVSGEDFIAYLFASLDGVSKVGSYTGTESGLTIDCGFSSGARFVLIKRTDSTGDWYVWDSERGIIVGDDPYLLLNSTSAEVTNTDYILPNSSGFRMQAAAQNAGLNNIGGSYIFYAIA